MSRLTTEEINHICNSVDIIDIVSKYIPLTQKGKNFFGVCPFHDDHSPSMSVSKDKQIYKCFSCGATGNVLKFIMDYENINFMEGLKMLAEHAGIPINIDIKSFQSTNNTYKNLYDMYEFSLKFYQNNLNTKDGLEAKKYLYNREIDEEVIKTFDIGLAIKNRDMLTKLLLKKGFNAKDIDRTGLVNKTETGIIDIYYNRIMFPLYDLTGKVVGYSGRVYDGTSTSKYINTKETEIFKKGELLYNYHRAKDECRIKNQVIIMEGFMDVIRTYTIGIKNVVATMGTAVTKQQAMLIKKLGKEVILLFDGDEAGQHAAMSCSDELAKLGVTPKVVLLEDNLDPDDYIKQKGKEAFLNKLNRPMNIMDFKLDYLKKKRNLNNTIDLSNYVNDVIKQLNKIDDEILKEISIQKISKESGLEVEFLKSKLENKEEKKVIKPKVELPKQKLTKYEKAENYLLYYMMKSPEVVDWCIKKLVSLPTKAYRDLYRMIVTYYKEFHEINEANFISYIIDKEEIYMQTIEKISSYSLKETYTKEEIEDYMKTILDYNIEEEKRRLNQKLKMTTDSEERKKIGQQLLELKARRDNL